VASTGAPDEALVVDQLLAAAARARASGAMVQAAGFYKQILDRHPGHRLASYNAGIILENAGRPELAIGVWRQALAADAGDLFAYEHLVRNLAATGGLAAELAALKSAVGREPAAQVPRLQQALVLNAAGRRLEAADGLRDFLLDHPSSNIAYNFLKDSFASAGEYRAFLDQVDAAARKEGAGESLRLLNVRLLLERGRAGQAMAVARQGGWEREESLLLLSRAGLLAAPGSAEPVDLPPPDTASRSSAEAGETPLEEGDVPADAGGEATPGVSPEMSVPELHIPDEPADELPDFGPDDPRSASRYEQEGRAALRARDDSAAMAALRRTVEAAPLRLQPRILLALLLEQGRHSGAARAVLRGPVEPSPWDVYQQGWRAVRDDFIDADYRGADIFASREQARGRVKTLADAKEALAALLASLQDRYALLFTPERFAGYLLTPNARAGAPEVRSPWIPVPDDAGTDPAGTVPAAEQAGDTGDPGQSGDAGAAEQAGDAGAAEQDPGIPLANLPPREMPDVDPSGRAGMLKPHALRVKPPVGDTAPAASAGRPAGSGEAAAGAALLRDPGLQVVRLSAEMGYLAIPSLAALDLPQRVDLALSELAGIDHLVIDLRGNRGGDGEVAVEVASLLLLPGREVSTYQTRRGREVRRSSVSSRWRPGGRLAVLIDQHTASAAELLAVALAESAGALLVGERTAGKGVGQRALLLPDGSGMSLTRFRLLAPSGVSWDGRGLTPFLAMATVSPQERQSGAVDDALLAAQALLRSMQH
jgi:C-terminal processing protease CtpA/Prc